MKPCPFCATTWVDRACAAADVRLTALERRRLVGALLARRHLILSGPAGIGKYQGLPSFGVAWGDLPCWAGGVEDRRESIRITDEALGMRRDFLVA